MNQIEKFYYYFLSKEQVRDGKINIITSINIYTYIEIVLGIKLPLSLIFFMSCGSHRMAVKCLRKRIIK